MPPRVSYEVERGCGMRKVGGLYLVSPPLPVGCGRFPIQTTVCPTCGAGIKPARGFTWVDGDAIKNMAKLCTHMESELDMAAATGEEVVTPPQCTSCAMNPSHSIGRAGLVWIGTMHYPDPHTFIREGMVLGYSRRLPGNRLPRGFVIGETHVFLGHKFAVAPWEQPGFNPDDEDIKMAPGIFGLWLPTAAEKVVDEEYDEEEVKRLERRGITPVIVRPAQTEMEGLNG